MESHPMSKIFYLSDVGAANEVLFRVRILGCNRVSDPGIDVFVGPEAVVAPFLLSG